MGYFVFYLFFIIIYEKGIDSKGAIGAIKCWSVLICAALIISNQVVISNVSYHKAQMAYEKSYGVLTRIADRIEQTDGSKGCERILVIGALENSEEYGVELSTTITGTTDGYIIRHDDEVVGQSVLCSALNDYCEKNYSFIAGEEKTALMMREEVVAMEEWPAKSSVAVIDDIIIIKLGTEGRD